MSSLRDDLLALAREWRESNLGSARDHADQIERVLLKHEVESCPWRTRWSAAHGRGQEVR